MTLQLYIVTDPSNTISKSLTEETMYSFKFKGQSDILRPTIEVFDTNDTIPTFNYAYIPQLKRYYFVSNIQLVANHYYVLELAVDVLQTYASDIKQSKGYISQNEKYNKYYNSSYASEVRTESDIYKSPNKIPTTNSEYYVLTTIGG